MREMKWHIVDVNDNPLCWYNENWGSERAVEFDSKEEAKEFLEMVMLNYSDFKMNGAIIVRSILFYDGGYVSGVEETRLMEEELNEN